jgi:hypothetical protein
MSAEPLTLTPQCETCREVATGNAERWQVYWIDDGPEERLVFYWPKCAEPEFADS